MSDLADPTPNRPSRRTAIKAFLGLGLAGCASYQQPGDVSAPAFGGVSEPATVPTDGSVPAAVPDALFEEHEHPARGDRFVFAFGDREGRVISPEDVPLGGPQITAYPADADGGHIASASRLDQVILVRVDPTTLSQETGARSAAGIVAYSGICTHTGCEVSDWDPSAGRLVCPCHDSRFDPRDNATVVEGPAPRRLAALPVEIVDGELRAAGGFIGRLGAQRP